MKNTTLGEIVYSRAGRDANKYFVIVGIIDESYVLLSDGSYRRFEKAKKKKIKHLKFTGIAIETIKDKLINNIRVTNAEIRRALASHLLKLREDSIDEQNLRD